jgi:hypothetical protein
MIELAQRLIVRECSATSRLRALAAAETGDRRSTAVLMSQCWVGTHFASKEYEE